ncbi:MAG: hypothetical protein ACI3Z0_00695 [Candidatus Cryptobacteroides sp.]
MKRNLNILAVAAFLMAGCTAADHGASGAPDITHTDVIGLYSPDGAFGLVDRPGMQVCVNPGRHQFRLQNGDQSSYVDARFSSGPQESAKVNVSLRTSGTFIPSGEYEMETVKADGSRIWLRSATFNLIIPAL